MKTEMTDRQLVTLVLGGKTQAYSDIVSRHSALVFAKAMGVVRCRDLAAEIAQQTFVRAYTRLADWHGDDSIAPWLAMIAVRLSLTHLDTARRRRAVSWTTMCPTKTIPPSTNAACSAWSRLSRSWASPTGASCSCITTATRPPPR